MKTFIFLSVHIIVIFFTLVTLHFITPYIFIFSEWLVLQAPIWVKYLFTAIIVTLTAFTISMLLGTRYK